MSAPDASYVPDLILEQYRLDELAPEEAARIERLLANDTALRDRLAGLERSDEEIARRYPTGWIADRVRDRLAAAPGSTPPPPRTGRRLVLVAALTAGAIAIAVALPWRTGAPTPEGDGLKGLAPALAVYRRTGAGSETLADGAAARAGDLLRLGYVSAGREYGVILSIDGRGVVTVLLPPDGGRAAALRDGGTVLLDAAYELDDAPVWERFYFVTANRPFDVARVLDAAREAARRTPRTAPPSLPLPRDYDQSTFSIVKEDKP